MAISTELLRIVFDMVYDLVDFDRGRFHGRLSCFDLGDGKNVVDELKKNRRMVGYLC